MGRKEDRQQFWLQHEQQANQVERAKPKQTTDKTKAWKLACAEFLAVRSYCESCSKRGYTNVAEHVHHVQQPGNNPILFWAISNWQALCAQCYSHVECDKDQQVLNTISKDTLKYIYTVN